MLIRFIISKITEIFQNIKIVVYISVFLNKNFYLFKMNNNKLLAFIKLKNKLLE